MRILTIGALIVAVGTFAALPFRRYRAKPQTVPPTEATGPTKSTLDGLDFEMLVEDSAANAEFPSLSLPPATPLISRQRQIQMPLTYDDLAVPLKLPPSFNENFSATSTAQQAEASSERSTSSRLQSATITDESKSKLTANSDAPKSVLADETEIQPARLVSSPAVDPVNEQLPAPSPQPRHWIRQP